MMDQPAAHEIVSVVREFIEQKVMPELKGHSAFHARVAANALGIVARELEQGPAAAEAEHARLKALLGADGSLADLNRELAARIRDERIAIDDPALKDHLARTTFAKVAIDQPGYSGLKAALAMKD